MQPPLAIECDDVEILKRAALASDTVLAAPHAAVGREIEAGALLAVAVEGLEPLHSEMGVVSLARPNAVADGERNHRPAACTAADSSSRAAAATTPRSLTDPARSTTRARTRAGRLQIGNEPREGAFHAHRPPSLSLSALAWRAASNGGGARRRRAAHAASESRCSRRGVR